MPTSKKHVDNIETKAGEGSSSADTPINSAAATPRNGPGARTPLQSSYKLPSGVRFVLVAIISFAISSMGYSFINEFTTGELATIMRTLETDKEIAVLTAWRLTELAIGWVADFDSVDLAALNLLSHSPTFYLMTAFYNLSSKTALAGLTVDIVAGSIPFLLMRPLSGAHGGSAPTHNREILADRSITVLSTLLATFIYGVVLFLSYNTYLRSALILHFEGIHTIEPSHKALLILTSLLVFSGIAARSFMFTPLAATSRTEQDKKTAQFDPVEATLRETVWWNLWGYTSQTKIGIVRSTALMVVTGVNTYLQCALTVSGVESSGAAIYSLVWTLAAFLACLGLGFMGEE